MNRVLLSLVIMAFATATAQAVHPGPDPQTTETFQAILDTTGGGGTYVDLDEVNAPDVVSGWGFPDGSDDAHTINGNVADEKGNGGEDFAMTLIGLSADTTYNIDAVIFGRGPDAGVFDVAGGFTPGNLPGYLWTDGTQVSSYVNDAGTDIGMFRVPLGAGTSDGAGNLVVYLGGNGGFGEPDFARTELDGVIYSLVPEPSTALLAAMGLLGLFCRGKRRSA